MSVVDMFSAAVAKLTAVSPWALFFGKVTLLLVVAWLLHLALARANPRWRIVLWRGTAFGMVLLTLWSFGLPGMEIHVSTPPPDEVVASPVPPDAVGRDPNPAPSSTASLADVPAFTEKPTVEPAPVVAHAEPTMFARLFRWLATWTWLSIVVTIWAVGMALLVVRLAIGYVRLTRLVQTTEAAPEAVVAEAQRIADALGCRRAVEIRMSGRFAVPFLYGLRRPVVVLPEPMCEPAYGSQLPGVLAHELAHIRSHDYGWNAAMHALSMLLWFHPLMWRIGAAHRAACDAVCDAVSAAYLGDVRAYCRTLALVALETARSLPSAGLAMAQSCDVRRRIAFLDRKVFGTSLKRRALVAVIILGLSACALFAGLRLVKWTDEDVMDAIARGPRVCVATEGRVTAVWGRGIAGATVTQEGTSWTTTTDTYGRFSLPEMKKSGDTTLLTLSAQGFVKHYSWLKYSGTEYWLQEGWPIRLLRTATLSGRVLGPDGKALANAPLSLDGFVHEYPSTGGCYSGRGFAEVVTDAEGCFTMDQIPPGAHILYYPTQAYGCYRTDASKELPPIPVKGIYAGLAIQPTGGQKMQGLVLDLSQCTGSIAGQVIGPDGKPMAGASVRCCMFNEWKRIGVSGDMGPRISAPVTDATGRFEFKGLGPGRWQLDVKHPNYQRSQPSPLITLAPRQTLHQDLLIQESYDADPNWANAADEAERTDDLNKLPRVLMCLIELHPVTRESAANGSLEVADFMSPYASGKQLWINVKSLGLPDTATPEEIARAAHAGELYFESPDRLVTINGTIVAPFTPPPDFGKETRFGRMTRAQLVEQVEASRRENPDADGRRITVRKGERFIVVRPNGQGYLVEVLCVGEIGPEPDQKDGIRLDVSYLGHLRLSPSARASGQAAKVGGESPTDRADDGTISLTEAVRAVNQQAEKLAECRGLKLLTEDEVVKAIDAFLGKRGLSEGDNQELKRIVETRRLPKDVVLRQFVRYNDGTGVEHGWWVRLSCLNVPIREEPAFRRPYSQKERTFQAEFRRTGKMLTMNRLVAYFDEDPKFGSVQAYSEQEADRLADGVKKAIEDKNADELLRIYHWEGVDDETRAAVRAEAETFVKRPLRSVSVSPRRFGGRLNHWQGLKTWDPNLPVLGYVVLEFADAGEPKSVWLEFGETQGNSRLVNYIVSQDDGPRMVGKPLSGPITVRGIPLVPLGDGWYEWPFQIDAPDDWPALQNANYEVWKIRP